jgi:predicted porin
MKKTLLALAALGAFAGAASAQSSVTLFGVVDVNGRWLDNDGVKQYQMSQDGLSPSRLGFRGTEDMGAGLYGGF